MYCGHADAFVEVCENNVWEQKTNGEIIDKNEGEVIPIADASRNNDASRNDDASENDDAS